jgi:hypothetical protein
MILARIFTKIYKEGGIILIDCKRTKIYLWQSKKRKTNYCKILKENLKWKLIIRSRT